jgi:hypothetical protein
MIFKAHIPHVQSNQKTWFGYWKEDGFVKTKHKGRIDQNKTWNKIRDEWVESYRNRDDIPGESVKQYVTHDDEWVSEAYLETNYSALTKGNFEAVIKNYAVFKLMNDIE